LTNLLSWLDESPRQIHEVAYQLERARRELALGWWHAADLDSALQTLNDRMGQLGLTPLDAETFAARHALISETIDEEEAQRRHQLGFAAVHANAQLSDGRTFVCLGHELATESDEPTWALLSAEEHSRLAPLGSAPDDLEAGYSGARVLPTAVARPEVHIERMAPHDAHLHANGAFRDGRYAEALEYLPRAALDGSHGLLAELMHIEALQRLDRHDEATALWGRTADDWLSDRRRVWDTQWKRLLELHGILGLPEGDPRLGRIRANAS
jgi:hypothetical protein